MFGSMARTLHYDVMPDLISSQWASAQSAGGNREQLARAQHMLRRIIREQLTDKQRLYLTMYYGERRSMTEIAQSCGVSLSTVSRTLTRARRRIEEVMKYYDFRGSSAEIS